MITIRTSSVVLGAGLAILAACGGDPAPHAESATEAVPSGTAFTVTDTTITAMVEAPGTAEPITQSTVSTKLMGTVTAILVQEGDVVRAGQVLARIDARDVEAKGTQVQAAMAAAEAARNEAALYAGRMRALFADSAAPKAQLDAAEAGLQRAEAGVNAARAGRAEVDAIADYATVRSPSAGVVTQRWVDPGAFAAPGAPLVSVQDQSRLRVTATAQPVEARTLRRGQLVDVVIEGTVARGVVEAVVPSTSGGLYTINAIVPNGERRLAAGGTATLRIPNGTRSAILIPAASVRRQGDLTGVVVRTGNTATTRWVRVSAGPEGRLEVLGGLRAGDVILVPTAPVRGS
ncbi:MAG: efflux RND transporter periplasmic adaptor subunit [Gemmatimonadetes bacterium]|nr:efflux RND transporter periplasmic adaptor subunit [Gemmatimonadota bacterium]